MIDPRLAEAEERAEPGGVVLSSGRRVAKTRLVHLDDARAALREDGGR